MRAISLLILISFSPLLMAQAEKPFLDISIEIFDMNLPQDVLLQEQAQIYPAVRQAEARYLPSFLKLTLQESGAWGAVRLLPDTDIGAEIQVSASILNSDGASLELELLAMDATGRIWLTKRYRNAAVESVSLNQPLLGTDPFLYLYSEISNDLLATYRALTVEQIQEIKAVASLRYAASLAPDAFGDFLAQDEEGLYRLNRLPADNDPLFVRVNEIREHEYVFIDVVDEQYQDFFVTIKPIYDLWRKYRRDQMSSEADKIQRETQQGNDLRRGSYMSLKESYNNFRWARMQDLYLDELNEGFTNEVLPTDITLEDSIYQLSGTLEEQYQEWRDILREFYLLENAGR